jgi:hypothetical protein
MSPNRPLLALIVLLAAGGVGDASAEGYRPDLAASLTSLRVEIVVLNDRVRPQIGYVTSGFDVPLNGPYPGMGMAQSAGVNALGNALGNAIVNAMAREDAEAAAKVAWVQLGENQCQLAASEELAAALEGAVTRAPWAGAATRSVQSGVDGPDKAEDVAAPRYRLRTSYSFTHDFANVVTTVDAALYSDAVPGAPKHWQRKPARQDEILVVSSPIQIQPITQADVDALDVRRREVHQAMLDRLAKDSRRDYYGKTRLESELRRGPPKPRRLADIKVWTLDDLRVVRVRRWSAGQCAPLRTALAANAMEAARVLGQVLDGTLAAVPAGAPVADAGKAPDPALPPPVFAASPRRVERLEDGVLLSREVGWTTPLAYVYSWLPLEKSERP